MYLRILERNCLQNGVISTPISFYKSNTCVDLMMTPVLFATKLMTCFLTKILLRETTHFVSVTEKNSSLSILCFSVMFDILKYNLFNAWFKPIGKSFEASYMQLNKRKSCNTLIQFVRNSQVSSTEKNTRLTWKATDVVRINCPLNSNMIRF